MIFVLTDLGWASWTIETCNELARLARQVGRGFRSGAVEEERHVEQKVALWERGVVYIDGDQLLISYG